MTAVSGLQFAKHKYPDGEEHTQTRVLSGARFEGLTHGNKMKSDQLYVCLAGALTYLGGTV